VTIAEWSAWLRKMAQRREIPLAHLAAQVPLSESAMYKLAGGKRLPTVRTAEALARLLDAPMLASSVIRMRTKSCVVCSATFVDQGKSNQGTRCGEACRKVDGLRIKSERAAEARRYEGAIATHRLKMYSDAVVAFCNRCEPEGICRDARCELRPASPLQFIPMSSATRRAG
jgi:DNA-binding XRE family transcriptional regulator